MDICLGCNIYRKLSYCCGSNPDTGEIKALNLLDGAVVDACSNLDSNGLCMDYENRLDSCRSYECFEVRSLDLLELFEDAPGRI